MTAPIFYLDHAIIAQCAVGDTLEVTGDEGHHAKNVKRLQPGEDIHLADGRGQRVCGKVHQLSDDGLSVLVESIHSEQFTPEIYLVQALAKNDRDLLGIELATELGAVGVVPWSAHRSIVQWKGSRADKAHAKWEKTVAAAAKQARRALIPTVYDLHSTKQLAGFIEEVTDQGAEVFVLDEREGHRLSEHIRQLDTARLGELYIVVGPEGGISEYEVSQFIAAGAKTGVLGPEILRASTAGAAAISQINTLLGRW